MGLSFFNTRTRSIELFKPLDPAGRKVGMYCCGPTVHDFAHIGNFRTFVFADLVRRYLTFKGYEVLHVMNVTDVEDKIIARVREQKVGLKQFTGEKEAVFWRDLLEPDRLGCLRPHVTPHATEHIPEIIDLIGKLFERGLAYQTSEGSVYFSIQKYREAGFQYGQLTSLNLDEMRVGERVRSDEYAKESAADFALWKSRTPEDGAVFWPSPWGEGRPGWHIECSAMSVKYLGPSFDLHLGGEDLIFPHHEDEIAQSEGAGLQQAGGRFVNCWLHGAHLLAEGKKMSKSLGNFYTLQDLFAKNFSGREIRFSMINAHYREPFNFKLDGLQAARTALARLDDWHWRLGERAASSEAAADSEVLDQVASALDNDLNVSAAWAVIFEWVRETNRRLSASDLPRDNAAVALATWARLETIWGIRLKSYVALKGTAAGDSTATAAVSVLGGEGETVPQDLLDLLEKRQVARREKNFKQADAIRDELKQRGWVIEDTPKGARLKPSR